MVGGFVFYFYFYFSTFNFEMLDGMEMGMGTAWGSGSQCGFRVSKSGLDVRDGVRRAAYAMGVAGYAAVDRAGRQGRTTPSSCGHLPTCSLARYRPRLQYIPWNSK